MGNLHFCKIILPAFVFKLLAFAFLSSGYAIQGKYFINCGSDSPVLVKDRTFVGDMKSGSFSVGRSQPVKASKPSADTPVLYHTARIYKEPSRFEVKNTQKGTYFVRLHFLAFTSSVNLADAVFNVSTSNFSLLSNFNIRNQSDSPVIKEFLLEISSESFSIYFIPAQRDSLAFVNAIEVFLVPDNLLIDNQFHVTPAGSKGTFNGTRSQVLRTAFRVDVGGRSVNDSLWRNWIQDDDYLVSGNSSNLCSDYVGSLKYVLGGADEYSAPDNVYKTCRELKGEGSKFSKLTWNFNVSKSTKHHVRAHFCDIVSDALNTGNLSLYIYNNFSQLINPYRETGDSAAPFYKDFVVNSDESGVMSISVGPNLDSYTIIAYINGLEIMEFMNPSGVLPPIQLEQVNNKERCIIIGSVASATTVFIFLMILSLWVLRSRKKSKPVQDMDSVYTSPFGGQSPYIWMTERTIAGTSLIPNLNLKLKMPFQEILDATQNFNVKLLIGEGGFGKVYKGTLRSGKNVAVKRSDSRHGQGLPEFQTEILVLSKIRHRHLVSLIGYCDEGFEMILVYEFMEKGSLRDHLYNSSENGGRPSSVSQLTWKQRLEICIGAAKGLHYLHTGAEGGIIHRDVKPTNILLDDHYVAKVADFGLSRPTPLDTDDFSMGIKGSFGYLDPEYFRSLQFTAKSDVYSFGVVLLEVLCARPAIMTSTRREEVNLADWGIFWLKKGQLENIIDPFLVAQINPNSLRKFGEIVDKCLKSIGADRPAMCDVLWDLEYALQLQQTAVQRQPHEDSAIDTSSNLETQCVQQFHSENFSVEVSDVSIGGKSGSTTPAGVFSQLTIDGGR